MDATKICETVKKSLSDGVSVCVTDGTVTRKVVDICHDIQTQDEGYLDITIDNGDGSESLIYIRTKWEIFFYEPDGYDLVDLNGEMFIAPDWWIAI